jgi:hypothetical protein
MKARMKSAGSPWSWLLLGLALIATSGCGGFRASKSFSPLDFFMPFHIRNNSPAPLLPEGTNAVIIAESRFSLQRNADL